MMAITASQWRALIPIITQLGVALLPYVGIALMAVAGWLGTQVALRVHNTRVLALIHAGVQWAEAEYPATGTGAQKKSAVVTLIQQAFPRSPSAKGSRLSALIEQAVAQLPTALPAFDAALSGAPVTPIVLPPFHVDTATLAKDLVPLLPATTGITPEMLEGFIARMEAALTVKVAADQPPISTATPTPTVPLT